MATFIAPLRTSCAQYPFVHGRAGSHCVDLSKYSLGSGSSSAGTLIYSIGKMWRMSGTIAVKTPFNVLLCAALGR